MKHPALFAASLVLIGGSAVACGGGAPADASKGDFCNTQLSIMDDVDMTDPQNEPDEKELASAIQSWGERMEKVGTPKGISDDARAGFEQIVDQAKDIDADDLDKDDLSKLDEELSGDEKKNGEAFSTYVSETCADMIQDQMPEMPEMPSETPES